MQDESTKLDAWRTVIKVGLDDFDDGNFTLLNSPKQIVGIPVDRDQSFRFIVTGDSGLS